MKKTNNTIRIIGGKYRGRKITFPDVPGLRPTPDRVRETVFNWLMHNIRGATCLDLFAGSGALGFEAYSRGAAHVVLLEKNLLVFQHLNTIAQAFDTKNLQIIHAAAETYLSTFRSAQFDIVFMDPPFAHPELFQCIQILERHDIIAANGLLYIESPQTITLDPQIWDCLKSKRSGQVTYGLYRRGLTKNIEAKANVMFRSTK